MSILQKMENVEKLVARMRRLWVLEHCARRGLMILGLSADAVLACLLLGKLAGLGAWSIAVVGAATAVAMAALIGQAVVRASGKHFQKMIAQALDHRTGRDDLFASAMEFASAPQQAGPLGELTCELAAQKAPLARPRAQWSLGAMSKWIVILSAAVLLLAANGVLTMSRSHQTQQAPVAAVQAPPRVLAPASMEQTPQRLPEATVQTSMPAMIEDTQPASRPTEETVRITSEMIDKYLAQMPDEKIDLEGVTPVRWDVDEVSGKDQPDPNKTGEKIDPVKLDAALLKDLQTAKKTKEEGGSKEGGVDIAVMSDKPGEAAKGKEGGKKGDESLADAVSKDPRGDARRLGIPLERKGFMVQSSARFPSKQKGEDRPMGLLEFLTAMERLKTQAIDNSPVAGPGAAPAENVIRQELLPAGTEDLSDEYFSRLRKADR